MKLCIILYFSSLFYLNSAYYKIFNAKCIQPNFEAYNELQQFVEDKPYYDCSHGKPLLTKIINNFQTFYLVVDPEAIPFYLVNKMDNNTESLNCFYSYVHRRGTDSLPDVGFFLSQRYPFSNTVDITHAFQFEHNKAVYVDCYHQYLMVYKNVHQPIIVSRDIRRKMYLAQNLLSQSDYDKEVNNNFQNENQIPSNDNATNTNINDNSEKHQRNKQVMLNVNNERLENNTESMSNEQKSTKSAITPEHNNEMTNQNIGMSTETSNQITDASDILTTEYGNEMTDDPNEIPESKHKMERSPINEPQNSPVDNSQNTQQPKRHINVLMVVIDSVALANFDRTMPNTSNYIRSNGFVPLDGYNKIAFNTYPNFMAMISGFNASTSAKRCDPTIVDQLDKCPLIWYDYRNAGYVTAYAEDHSRISTFNYQKVGFTKPPTDYYFKSYLEATESLLQPEIVDGMPFCTGMQSAGERILELARNIAITFQNAPHFGVFWMNTFSHDNWNAPRRMDRVFVDFFQELKLKEVLDNDVVMFLSDHGYRFHDVMMTTQNFYEERTPFNFISIPLWMQHEFPTEYQNLIRNRRKLTSNYDVFMTLQHLLSLQTSNYTVRKADSCPNCKSLLESIENRSCYEAGIPDAFCTCTGDLITIPTNHPLVNMTLWRMPTGLQSRVSILNAKKSQIVNSHMYVIVFAEDVWMRTGYIATSLVLYETIPPRMKLLRLQEVQL